MLTESGLPSINERIEYMTASLIYKILCCNNSHLFDEILKASNRKYLPKRLSAIHRVLITAKKLNVSVKPTRKVYPNYPPWLLSDLSIETRLQTFQKQNTCPQLYAQNFLEYKAELSQKAFNFIFTDGSKTKFSTSFAVVSENLDVLRKGILPNHCSIYTSEIFAIYQAALIASKTKDNFCICTDSRSAIDALWKFKKDSVLVTHTRDLLIKHKNKIKLIWIPGHCGLQGNELADSVAKSLHNDPVICFDTFEKADLSRHVRRYINNKSLLKWKEYVHHYADINPTKIRPTFPSDAKQSDILVFTRLRLGHTQITHGHLLSHGVSSCNVCGAMSTSVKHILDICPRFSIQRQRIFGLTVPSQLLSDTAALNISKISSFIASYNLSHLI
ncbi:uncharacterized protein LOC120776078 [Bactrocera tryoni]|uniref:uncharacterized protein LOC120776078 n=1 Tax=Bactrocera tryoni TaxID=59916 RepID=UPI001A98CF29|nr:uncharacterized protein LOC120776078 [Bactrocera tryoni]